MTLLRQTLTLFEMTTVASGATIGSGILLTSAIIAQLLPVPCRILAVCGLLVPTALNVVGVKDARLRRDQEPVPDVAGRNAASPRVAADAVALDLLRIGGGEHVCASHQAPGGRAAVQGAGVSARGFFFVIVSVWFVAVTLVQKPARAWAGLGFLALGVPIYFHWRWRNR